MALESKPPIQFIVVKFGGDEVVYPPVATAAAGGNSVTVSNTLKKEVKVTHFGHLDAPDPFTIPAHNTGAPPQKTHAITASSDVPGKIFQLKVEASFVMAFGGGGDPTIIIL